MTSNTNPRPKIYVLFCKQPSIRAAGGDSINEMRFYRSLSQFGDLYYNDFPIDFKSSEYGGGNKILNPSRDYDLYYVRNNPDFFKMLPSPKFTMAYPYDKSVFKCADGIFTTNEAWKDLLRDHQKSDASKNLLSNFFPKQIHVPDTIINTEQSNEIAFSNCSDKRKLLKFKAVTLGARVLGLYGRITQDTFQADVHRKVVEISQRTETPADPAMGLAGSLRIPVPKNSIYFGKIPYLDMPYLYQNTFAALGGYTKETHYLGSTKILDAMQQGVPIVQRRTNARAEQLGNNYAGFYNDERELETLLEDLFFDPDFHDALSQQLKDRSPMFDSGATGQRIYSRLLASGVLSNNEAAVQ